MIHLGWVVEIVPCRPVLCLLGAAAREIAAACKAACALCSRACASTAASHFVTCTGGRSGLTVKSNDVDGSTEVVARAPSPVTGLAGRQHGQFGAREPARL
jgi:hypothetical protein